jgi:hypothetical protein
MNQVLEFKFTNKSMRLRPFRKYIHIFSQLVKRTGIACNVHCCIQNKPPLDEKSLFWAIRQAVVVITYRRFGTIFGPIFKGQYHYSLRHSPEERSSHPLLGGRLKSRNPPLALSQLHVKSSLFKFYFIAIHFKYYPYHYV